MRDGHYAIFFGDQVGDGEIHTRRNDFSATLITVVVANQLQFLDDHFHQAFLAVENAQQLANLLEDFLIFSQ